jgi:hypothetical protein
MRFAHKRATRHACNAMGIAALDYRHLRVFLSRSDTDFCAATSAVQRLRMSSAAGG